MDVWKLVLTFLCVILLVLCVAQFIFIPRQIVEKPYPVYINHTVEVIKYVDKPYNVTEKVIEYKKYCPSVDHPSATSGEIEKWINFTDTPHNVVPDCAKQHNISLCPKRNNFLEQ